MDMYKLLKPYVADSVPLVNGGRAIGDGWERVIRLAVEDDEAVDYEVSFADPYVMISNYASLYYDIPCTSFYRSFLLYCIQLRIDGKPDGFETFDILMRDLIIDAPYMVAALDFTKMCGSKVMRNAPQMVAYDICTPLVSEIQKIELDDSYDPYFGNQTLFKLHDKMDWSRSLEPIINSIPRNVRIVVVGDSTWVCSVVLKRLKRSFELVMTGRRGYELNRRNLCVYTASITEYVKKYPGCVYIYHSSDIDLSDRLILEEHCIYIRFGSRENQNLARRSVQVCDGVYSNANYWSGKVLEKTCVGRVMDENEAMYFITNGLDVGLYDISDNSEVEEYVAFEHSSRHVCRNNVEGLSSLSLHVGTKFSSPYETIGVQFGGANELIGARRIVYSLESMGNAVVDFITMYKPRKENYAYHRGRIKKIEILDVARLFGGYVRVKVLFPVLLPNERLDVNYDLRSATGYMRGARDLCKIESDRVELRRDSILVTKRPGDYRRYMDALCLKRAKRKQNYACCVEMPRSSADTTRSKLLTGILDREMKVSL